MDRFEMAAGPSSDLNLGILIGILIGEGHFGGDGKQPQITLRMHTKHESLFQWIQSHFPGGVLYGPYEHGGRRYYQWMARGRFLREDLLPRIESRLTPEIDAKTWNAVQEMKIRYKRRLGIVGAAGHSPGLPDTREQDSTRAP